MRGAVAKQTVENKIREAFGKDFLGVSEKKLYVQAEEDGEMVQVCLSLTCPKAPLSFGEKNEFKAEGNFGEPDVFEPVKMTSEELEHTRKLIREFGL